MILGLDLYDTVTAWPVSLRKLARDVMDSGGEVHVVTAIKRVNEDRTRRHFKDARIPHTAFHILFYEIHSELPNLKTPKYKELGCDVVIEDNTGVVAMLRHKGVCALEIGGFSNSPITLYQ